MTGQLFVSDTNSRKIYQPKSLAGTKDLQSNTDVVAGTGEHCLPFDENHCGDGGKAPEASLTGPKGRDAKLMKKLTDKGAGSSTQEVVETGRANLLVLLDHNSF